MINLLPNTQKDHQNLDRYRHLAFVVTHVILVVYILYLASISGLMLFGDQKQKGLTVEIESLERELTKYSKTEALMLSLEATAKAIKQFNSARTSTASYLQSLNSRPSTVTMTNWVYKPGSVSRITLQSQSHADLEEFTQILRKKYPASVLEQATTKGGVWNSSIVLK